MRHSALRSRLESLLITVGIGFVIAGTLGEATVQLGVVETDPISSILQVSGLLVLSGSVMWAGFRARSARNLRGRRGLVPWPLSPASTFLWRTSDETPDKRPDDAPMVRSSDGDRVDGV